MDTNQNTPKLTDKPQVEQVQEKLIEQEDCTTITSPTRTKDEVENENEKRDLKEYEDKHEHKYKTPISEPEIADKMQLEDPTENSKDVATERNKTLVEARNENDGSA